MNPVTPRPSPASTPASNQRGGAAFSDSGITTRRKAAWTLNKLVKELQLGTLAEHFDPEHHQDWDVMGPSHAIALKDNQPVAEVLFADHKAMAFIRDIFDIIRPQHLSDFDPCQYGIQVKNYFDWDDEKAIDLVAEIEMRWEEIPGLNLPARPMPRRMHRRDFKVISSL